MFHKINIFTTLFGAAALLLTTQTITLADTPVTTDGTLNVNGAVSLNSKPFGAVYIAANYLKNQISGYGYLNTSGWKFMGNATTAEFTTNADGTVSSHFVFYGLYTVKTKRSVAQMDITTTSNAQGVGKVGFCVTGLYDSSNKPLVPPTIISASGPTGALLTQVPVTGGYVSLILK